MKRTFILALIVVVVLGAMYYLPSLTIFGVQLRKVDILSDVRLNSDTEQKEAEEAQQYEDSIRLERLKVVAKTDSVPEGMIPIEDFRDSLMIDREMDSFYEALSNSKKRVVRIAYFGDSFIEGDIFTANLRDYLQTQYGGCGVGFIDIHSQVAGFRTTVIENSSGWQDYSVIDRGKGFNSALQGINSRYYIPNSGARINVRGQQRVFPEHLDSVNQVTLFYTPEATTNIVASINGKEAKCVASHSCSKPDSLLDSVQSVSLGLKSEVYKGKIGSFTADVSGGGRFYGLALEGTKGVVVDNFSMRGSVGWHLSTIPVETLTDFAKLRHYDLIIMHYGLNMSTPTRQGYYAYCDKFKKGIHNFRKAYPKTSILIVSVSNRDRRGANGQFETMKGVTELVAAQRQMAQEEHVAFWNLQQAMGGSGSTAKMQREGLANLDYTHINFKGGAVLGKLLFDVLENGKMNYQRRLKCR